MKEIMPSLCGVLNKASTTLQRKRDFVEQPLTDFGKKINGMNDLKESNLKLKLSPMLKALSELLATLKLLNSLKKKLSSGLAKMKPKAMFPMSLLLLKP